MMFVHLYKQCIPLEPSRINKGLIAQAEEQRKGTSLFTKKGSLNFNGTNTLFKELDYTQEFICLDLLTEIGSNKHKNSESV